MQDQAKENAVSYFTFEYLKAGYQNFIDNVDIFSTNRYKNTTEMVINSLAYLGYVSILYALNATVGRLALLGFAVYDFYKGEYALGLLNLFLCFVPLGIELLTFCMALLGLYRAGMFAYDNSPEFKRHFNVIFPCAKSSSKEAVEGVDTIDLNSTTNPVENVVETDGNHDAQQPSKESNPYDPLVILKKDFMRKKECVTDLCSKAYQLFTNKSTSSSTNENMNQASVLNR